MSWLWIGVQLPGEDDSLAPELKLFPYLAIQSLNGDYQLLVLNYLYAQRLFLERVLVFCHSFQDIVIEIREAQTIAVCYWSTCHWPKFALFSSNIFSLPKYVKDQYENWILRPLREILGQHHFMNLTRNSDRISATIWICTLPHHREDSNKIHLAVIIYLILCN